MQFFAKIALQFRKWISRKRWMPDKTLLRSPEDLAFWTDFMDFEILSSVICASAVAISPDTTA
jgi:hypothetical protein